MIALIAQGLGFGFTAGSSPGPFQSFLISTTLSQGWRRGILVIFSPLMVDPPIILLMSFLLGQLPGGVIRTLQVAGGVFVLYLAWGTWRSLQAGVQIGAEAGPSPQAGGARRVFIQAATMNALSPGPYIFWGSVTGPILVDALGQGWPHAVAFLLAFYGAFLGMMAILVFIFERVRRLDARVTRIILSIAALILFLLGIGLIVQGIMG